MWSARCDMKCDKLSITFDWHSRHKDQIKVFLLTPIMSYHVTFIFFMRIYIQNKAIQPHTFTHKSIKFENFFFDEFSCGIKEQELMDWCHFWHFFCSLFIYIRSLCCRHMSYTKVPFTPSFIHSHSSSSSWTCKAKKTPSKGELQ